MTLLYGLLRYGTPLLFKSKTFGIGSKVHSYISSLLKDRTQVVKIGQHFFDPQNITSAVLQGSIIGRLLFMMYVNDIRSCFSLGEPFYLLMDLKYHTYSAHFPVHMSAV